MPSIKDRESRPCPEIGAACPEIGAACPGIGAARPAIGAACPEAGAAHSAAESPFVTLWIVTKMVYRCRS